MLLINLIFLPAIFFVGLISAYEDITLSRIKNKWVILGIAYAAGGYLLLYGLSFLKLIDYGGLNFSYFASCAVNFGLSALVAYSFWKCGVWAPGDAKLFIAYSLLIPLDFYAKGYINYFPAAVLLFNIFIPLFFFIVILALAKLLSVILGLILHPGGITKARVSIGQLFKRERIKIFYTQLKGGLPAYLFIFIGLQVALMGIKLSPLWMAAALLVFQPLSQRIKQNRKLLFSAALLVLLYFVYKIQYGPGAKELLPLFETMIKTFALFGLLRILLAFYVKYTQVRKIEISQLKPQMIPTEEALKDLRGSTPEFRELLGSVYPDGFSEEQAEAVKTHCAQKGLSTIDVYRTFPLAAWMFMGVVITLIFRQSILTLIKSLL